MMIISIAFALGFASICAATFQPVGVPFKAPVRLASGFAAHVIFSNLTLPRGVAFDSSSSLLVVERGIGITAFNPTNTPSSGWERTLVIKNSDFTHGIQIDGSRLFVSTGSEVIEYTYDATSKAVTGSPNVIISGLPADGELTTHTLQLDKRPNGQTFLLVGAGPLTNIDSTARDPQSGRSQIRRFELPALSSSLPPTPQTWLSGQLIGYGIRNPAGFAYSPEPVTGPVGVGPNLYVVENGASIDNVTGITPTFANDNPADEMERIGGSPGSLGRFFGFPDCTTLWNPSADPVNVPQYLQLHRGDQFSLRLLKDRDDAWCQVTANNEPPVLSFQAHSVPLDIKFYLPGTVSSLLSFPSTFADDAFVSFHGSFNRNPPTGYGVVHVPFPLGSTSTVSDLGYSFIIQAADLTTCPGNCIRPVGLAFGQDARLYVSSDSSGELFVIERAAAMTEKDK